LSSNELDKALVYLKKIFDGNLQDNFDYMNMGYIFKMKGDFLKALEYYSKFCPQGPEHDFVRQDMIFCAENMQDNTKYFEMIDKLWKY
jgi:tetratricopeptide (TPR) repeat protein